MAAAASPAVAQPVSAQIVGNAFVQQYYHILHYSPELVYRFYQDISKLGRPEEDGSMSITTTMQAINDKIVSLNYGDFRAEIKSVDAQDSFGGGVHVFVIGYLSGLDNRKRNFAQTFFLAPQQGGYFVFTDMFRYVDNVNQNDVGEALVNEVESPPILVQNDPPPVQEDYITEEVVPSTGEVSTGEVYNPLENVNETSVEEEVLVAEVVDEVPGDSQMMVELNSRSDEGSKKSYASIVMDLKGTNGTLSPPPQNAAPESIEQVHPRPVMGTNGPDSSSEIVDSEDNLAEEADGYSIYIKGLPVNATVSMLAEEFKKFGPIKTGGIQVRSNRLGGFCFGFVEFEMASSVAKSIEASPIAIGGRQAIVEEKRSTNSRVNNRGRFQPGRDAGFRNEGARGRGNYGGGRGYGRGDFNNRGDFSYRGGNRGGSSNRGDGYQRSDYNGSSSGRLNRGGGMANGNVRYSTPRVSATA